MGRKTKSDIHVAHSSSDQYNDHFNGSKKGTMTKQAQFTTFEIEFQKRMIRQTLDKSLGKKLNKSNIPNTIEEECEMDTDSSTGRFSDERPKDHSSSWASCSFDQIYPNSWEYPNSTDVNEPGGQDPGTACRISQEPTVQNISFYDNTRVLVPNSSSCTSYLNAEAAIQHN